ncbi:MAG: hypothetical protein FD168_357 [Desulfobulbaceae bacterium]|nr:MAG: hypothetical protein FD168_357 [Desulfobulbaceae bacterium]
MTDLCLCHLLTNVKKRKHSQVVLKNKHLLLLKVAAFFIF